MVREYVVGEPIVGEHIVGDHMVSENTVGEHTVGEHMTSAHTEPRTNRSPTIPHMLCAVRALRLSWMARMLKRRTEWWPRGGWQWRHWRGSRDGLDRCVSGSMSASARGRERRARGLLKERPSAAARRTEVRLLGSWLRRPRARALLREMVPALARRAVAEPLER
jgi:hypothetical protein